MGKNSKKQQHDRVIKLTIRVNRKYINWLMIVVLICSSLVSDQAQLGEKPRLGQIEKNNKKCTD